MGSDEKYILERFGKENNFRVPDGYFESFASRMMEQLPVEKERNIETYLKIWHRYRYVAMVAACFFAVLMSIGIYIGKSNYSSMSCDNTDYTTIYNAENMMEYVADYSMMDNEDIYALVSDN